VIPFSAQGYSEGPAWWWISLTGLLFLPWASSDSRHALAYAIGGCVAGFLLFRTQYLLYFPAILALVYMLEDSISLRSLTLRVGIPILIALMVICVQYLFYLPSWDQVLFYFNVATKLDSSSGQTLIDRIHLLVPSIIAGVLLLILVMCWMIVGYITSIRKGLTTLAIFLVSGLLFALPLVGNSGYYPRHVIMIYVLAALGGIALILRTIHHEDDAVED